MSWVDAIILAVVEGLTEYLPISSTGHMIVVSAFRGINEEGFVKAYTIIVQFGAIASVLVLYWRQFLMGPGFYKKLFVAFLPAAVLGLLVKNYIDRLLGDVIVVAWALLVGGVILMFVDSLFERRRKSLKATGDVHTHWSNMSLVSAVKIGFIQCFAFIPGVSRAASTIIGGLFVGLNRQQAAEFSFLLAVPTLTGASFVKMLKVLPSIDSSQWKILLVGNVISFLVGLVSVKTFIQLLSRYGFFWFGVYRVILGILVLYLIR